MLNNNNNNNNNNIFYLNTIGFKAQSLWGRVKIITISNYIKIGIALIAKYNYHGKNLKIFKFLKKKLSTCTDSSVVEALKSYK